MATLKPIIVSGIQPSGELHIGNYLGSLKNFVTLQDSGQYQCYFFVADYHAMTESQAPEVLLANSRSLVASYLAVGLDPKKSTIFVQSHVPGHTELAWILSTLTPVAELFRMTQYKDKSAKQTKNVNTGLLTYPVLMAADILIYHSTHVPVGHDQLQHLEISRLAARWFNNHYGEYFAEPQQLLTEMPRVMSIVDPTRKMSKSAGDAHCLYLIDEPEVILKKLKRAESDSGAGDSAGGKNIFDLLKQFADADTVNHFTKQRAAKAIKFGELKVKLAEAIAEHFVDFRAKRAEFNQHPERLNKVIADGAKAAAKITAQTMVEVRRRVGLI